MAIIGLLASGGAEPTAPTIGTATAGNASATVAFTAPSYLGKSGSVTYTATSSPGGFTGTGTSPITVSGLTNGTAYTFTVRATTSYGVTGPSSAASNSITPAVPVLSSVEALVVAGGGGSGSGNSGGGGAGGLVYYATQPITIGTTYNFVVGAGGNPGGNSGNSTAFSMTAIGGGTGGGGTIGSDGGSGGGSWYNNSSVAGAATQGNSGGGTGYGNAGAPGSGGPPYIGGGGGGAGAAAIGSTGGAGRTYFGSTYAAGGNGGNTGNPGSNGAANTGNGGNSADSFGGSGVVIIRYEDIYADAASTTGSPTFTNSGGYKTYKFTASGSITF
jgi:hypothetical protein